MANSSLRTLDEQAQELRTLVDAALAEYVNFDGGCPDHLREAIQYSLLAPGKRLRPLLVLWACEACRGDRAAALPAACAVEMIHTYSLIHDDLPAMDDDDLRRGRPSCHKAHGEGIAILAGDALLTLAFEVLSEDIEPGDRAAACCGVLAHAAGACELVGGQADDLAGEFFSGGLAVLESIHRRKTGAMFRASIQLGAICANASNHQRESLDEYAKDLGLAFQIVDDLLDVRGDQATLGKNTKKDAARGKLTFPGVLGIDESERRARSLVESACAAIAPFGSHAASLEALAHYVLERNH
jgi:geranylgeranyl diphosphate synthase type II